MNTSKLDVILGQLAELRSALSASPLSDGAMPVKAAVAFSGLSRTELFALVADGKLPSVKHKGRRLIPRRPLVAYLERHLEPATA